jgi:hypothetical protein
MVRGTGVGKKMKQKASKMDDEMAMLPEREYGRRSTTPRSAARRSTSSSSPAKRAMPASKGRKPASAAKRPMPATKKGGSSKRRSGK